MNAFSTITSRLFDKVFRKDDIEILSSEPCEIDPITAIAIVESKIYRRYRILWFIARFASR